MTDLRLFDYKPASKLLVPVTGLEKPRFYVIDAHNHMGSEFGGEWDKRPVEELLDVLAQASVKMLVAILRTSVGLENCWIAAQISMWLSLHISELG